MIKKQSKIQELESKLLTKKSKELRS